jgi:hypothetical protein
MNYCFSNAFQGSFLFPLIECELGRYSKAEGKLGTATRSCET